MSDHSDNMSDPATPPKQSQPVAPTEAPATPGPMTPGIIQRIPPPKTPGATVASFSTRTPRTPHTGTNTPGGTPTACSTDQARFHKVQVHTAKCTECDVRNKKTMYRCPGCTFQICTPCRDKREGSGKGLMHGIDMSSGATPVTQRAVRNRPMASTPGDGSVKNKQKVVDVNMESNEAKKVAGKEKEKALPTVKPSNKKRSVRKKRQVVVSDGEESSDAFDLDGNTPTPSKRRRTYNSSLTAQATPSRPIHILALMAPRRADDISSSLFTEAPENNDDDDYDFSKSRGIRPGETTIPELMRMFGVKDYDEHLLSRREPVMSNLICKIPAIWQRGGKPRPSAAEIQQNIQNLTRKKMQENARKAMTPGQIIEEKTYAHLEAERTKATVIADVQPLTVKIFAQNVAERYRLSVPMSDGERLALGSAIETAALQWGKQIYRNLTPDLQGVMSTGLEVRMDLIDEAYKSMLESFLTEKCADNIVWDMTIAKLS